MKKDKKKILRASSFLLTLAWYGALLTLGLYLIGSAVVPLATKQTDGVATYVNALPVHFEVPAPAIDPNIEINDGTNPKALSIPQSDGIISFTTTDYKLNLIATFGVLLYSAVILFVIFQLRKIVAKVREEKPFVVENLNRMRKIAGALFAFSILDALYVFITSSIVQSDFYTELYLPNIKILPQWEIFNSDVVLLVVVILTIEESFRYGLKLQEDKDLTI